MNENFTVVTYQKICGKFATSKVIIVNLLKITADTFNGDNRDWQVERKEDDSKESVL